MPPPSQPSQSQHIVTPWRHHSDLLAVRANLYTPATPADQAHAISTIAAWKLRGNVPHAVESTALLFDAMFFHARTTGSVSLSSAGDDVIPQPLSGGSSFALRAAYTTALSRFVTGFADLGRHRSGVGQSMFDVARTIALPAHFVELRHEVAHEEMPGLARLVRSAREAVQWLWGVYWGRLQDDMVAAHQVKSRIVGESDHVWVEVGQVAERAKYLFGGFRSQRVASLKAKKGKREGKFQAEVTCNQCAELCRGPDDREKWEVVAGVLIEDGLIIPSLKQRGPLPDTALHGAYLVWDELLLQLSRRSDAFIESFLERAVAHVAGTTADDDEGDGASDAVKWAMYRWILHILCSSDWKELKAQADSSWEGCVLRECSLYPNDYWTRKLADTILSETDEDVRAVWGQEGGAGQNAEDMADGSVEVGVLNTDATTLAMDKGGWRQDDGPWQALPIGAVHVRI